MISHFFSLSLERQRGGKGWEREKESQERVNREFLLSFFPAFSCSLFLWMVSSEFHDTKERNVVFLNPFIFNYRNHQGFAASFQIECAYGSHTVCNSVVVADWSCCFISLSLSVCVCQCVCVCVCVCVWIERLLWYSSHGNLNVAVFSKTCLYPAGTLLLHFQNSFALFIYPASLVHANERGCRQKTFLRTTAQLQSLRVLSPQRPVNHLLSCQSSPLAGSALEIAVWEAVSNWVGGEKSAIKTPWPCISLRWKSCVLKRCPSAVWSRWDSCDTAHAHTIAAETGMVHILTGLEAEVFEAVVSLICLLTPLSLLASFSCICSCWFLPQGSSTSGLPGPRPDRTRLTGEKINGDKGGSWKKKMLKER